MSLDDIYEGFMVVRERLNEKLQHPYLMRYIESPFVDEEKLFVLYSVLKSANLHIEEIQHYVLAIMLVQIALDTHERVSNKDDVEEGELHRRRQLTVLAGDYYSGLYYYLLAMQHDIALIRKLAAGIEEINEEKIVLYRNGKTSIESVIDSIACIESSLLRQACDHFHVPEWKIFISTLLAMKRIEREYTLYVKDAQPPIFAAFEHILQQSAPGKRMQDQICDLYESYMREAKASVASMAANDASMADVLEGLNI